ncbi:MAG: hypothetical protein A2X45_11105 [Lentisphaerae bacterium GWF2_50_93]|nr:MAG: hypothetical protein A2X45_11105 [Lentisphaerae bacterium GWF2_50_93]
MKIFPALSAFAIFVSMNFVVFSEEAAKKPQVIILKLDDLTAKFPSKDCPAGPRWKKVVDTVEKKKIKASFGIILNSLEKDNQPYFDWIKDLNTKGNIEFWNHGMTHGEKTENGNKIQEFNKGSSYEEQKATLEKGQKLAKDKLGITLATLGTPFNSSSGDTEKALEDIPDIKIWLYGPGKPKISKKLILERSVNLEASVGNPDFDKFKEAYESKGKTKEYIVLQGHPPAWDDRKYENFEKIVDYLIEKGCIFMTPSEYLASKSQNK